MSDNSGASGVTPGIRWFALGYAAYPLAGALLWLAFGTTAGEVNRAPIHFAPYLELYVIFLAVRAGLTPGFVTGGLGPFGKAALAVAAASVVVSTALAPDPLLALERLAVRLPHVLAGISVAWLLCRADRSEARRLTLALAAQPWLHLPALGLLLALHLDDPEMNWLGGPVGYLHLRLWGTALAVSCAAAFGLAMAAGRRDARLHLLLFAALLVMGTLLFWSGSRGSALGLLAALVFACAAAPGRALPLIPAALAALAAGAALSTALPLPMYAWGLSGALAETTAASADAVSGSRLTIWRETLGLVLDRPILGHGHDQFALVVPQEPLVAIHPHNAVLQMLFDFGLPGGGAIVLLLLLLWLRAVRLTRSAGGDWRWGALMALNTLAVIALMDGVLYHTDTSLSVAVAFGVLLCRPRSAP